jgi:hypothetical protein
MLGDNAVAGFVEHVDPVRDEAARAWSVLALETAG